MTRHLATRDGILCHTVARWPATSGDLRDVTCVRCLHRLPVVVGEEDASYYTRRHMAAATEAAEFLGAGLVWSLVLRADAPTERMAREILAAVFIGLADLHRQDVAA